MDINALAHTINELIKTLDKNNECDDSHIMGKLLTAIINLRIEASVNDPDAVQEAKDWFVTGGSVLCCAYEPYKLGEYTMFPLDNAVPIWFRKYRELKEIDEWRESRRGDTT